MRLMRLRLVVALCLVGIAGILGAAAFAPAAPAQADLDAADPPTPGSAGLPGQRLGSVAEQEDLVGGGLVDPTLSLAADRSHAEDPEK